MDKLDIYERSSLEIIILSLLIVVQTLVASFGGLLLYARISTGKFPEPKDLLLFIIPLIGAILCFKVCRLFIQSRNKVLLSYSQEGIMLGEDQFLIKWANIESIEIDVMYAGSLYRFAGANPVIYQLYCKEETGLNKIKRIKYFKEKRMFRIYIKGIKGMKTEQFANLSEYYYKKYATKSFCFTDYIKNIRAL